MSNKALAKMNEGGQVVSMIERAAADPNFDATKMRQLIEMRNMELDRVARHEFNLAFNRVQKKVRHIVADASNPSTNSKYASYPALDAALRPIYTHDGFGISYNTGDSPLENHVRVFAEVSRGSHSRMYQCDIPCDGKGARGGDVMTKTHAAMSATTYGQRNLLKMIFGIAVTKDDDGNAAGASDYISPAQLEELMALMKETGALAEKVRATAKVETLAEIRARDFPRLMAGIRAWAKQQAKKNSDFPGDK